MVDTTDDFNCEVLELTQLIFEKGGTLCDVHLYPVKKRGYNFVGREVVFTSGMYVFRRGAWQD